MRGNCCQTISNVQVNDIGLYTVRQKKGTDFLLCGSFYYLTETGEFFLQTLGLRKVDRSISYNSVYLIFACVEIFAATVTLNVLCLPVK